MERTTITRVLATLAPLGLLAAALVPQPATAGAVAASSKPVVFTGKMACEFTAKISLSPAFTVSGTASVTTATMTVDGKMTDCGGPKGFTKHHVTITGGRLSAVGSISNSKGSANSCSAIALAGTLPKITGEATFTATGGKADPTKFSFSEGSFTTSTTPIAVAYPAKGATASASGSFAGAKGSATGSLKQTLSDLLNSCDSGSGLSTMTLESGTATFG